MGEVEEQGEILGRIRKIRQPSKDQGEAFMGVILGCFHAVCCSRSVGSFSDEGGSIEGHSPKKAKVF